MFRAPRLAAVVRCAVRSAPDLRRRKADRVCREFLRRLFRGGGTGRVAVRARRRAWDQSRSGIWWRAGDPNPPGRRAFPDTARAHRANEADRRAAEAPECLHATLSRVPLQFARRWRAKLNFRSWLCTLRRSTD